MASSEPPQQASLQMTWLHATLSLQFFVSLIQFMLAVWYAVVLFSPASISEYMPSEQTPSPFLIARFIVVGAVWLPIIYFTWKQRKAGLMASLAYSVALLIVVPLVVLTGSSGHPDFSDFVFFPTLVLLVISSVMGIRSLSTKPA
ncbi:MAG: hypothetical protein JRM98_00420 [Nitrososphaerota archaeon]|nr:hypothetical protein [Nitrososphaerota archaeon]